MTYSMFDLKIIATPCGKQGIRSIFMTSKFNYMTSVSNQIYFFTFPYAVWNFLQPPSNPYHPGHQLVRRCPFSVISWSLSWLKINDRKFTWVEWPERDLSASEIGIRMSSKWALNEISTSFLRLYELSPSYVKSLYNFS